MPDQVDRLDLAELERLGQGQGESLALVTTPLLEPGFRVPVIRRGSQRAQDRLPGLLDLFQLGGLSVGLPDLGGSLLRTSLFHRRIPLLLVVTLRLALRLASSRSRARRQWLRSR